MDFLADLKEIIASDFTDQGIAFLRASDVSHLTRNYLEMRIRRIEPVARSVHFSDEIQESLGNLARYPHQEHRQKALDAWRAVFRLRCLFVRGESVMPFLSKKVTKSETQDKLLWDYGMHHLHLNSQVDDSGFVVRSHWLLFAIVSDEDVYFVDVRPHTDPEGFLWTRQDLLGIVHNNWPELIESRVLQGVAGAELPEYSKKELRRKNINVAHLVGTNVIVPLGMGMTSDGHSLLFRYLADKLIYEIEWCQRVVENDMVGLCEQLVANGTPPDAGLEFKLVRFQDLSLSEEQIAELTAVDEDSKSLWYAGFAIIEMTTRALVIV